MKIKWQQACLSLEITTSSYGKKALVSDMNIWPWGAAQSRNLETECPLQYSCPVHSDPFSQSPPAIPNLPVSLHEASGSALNYGFGKALVGARLAPPS